MDTFHRPFVQTDAGHSHSTVERDIQGLIRAGFALAAATITIILREREIMTR